MIITVAQRQRAAEILKELSGTFLTDEIAYKLHIKPNYIRFARSMTFQKDDAYASGGRYLCPKAAILKILAFGNE